jgi:hypothetical protein
MKKYLKENINGKPRVFSVKSVSEFIEITTWLYSDDNVLFRGQAKEKDWTLVPSVGRNNNRTRIPWKEREILNEFKRETIPFLDFIPDNDNDWQWLAIAQHNRLPTRLIDWTRNPLVALWFAVKDPAIENMPCVVWAFHYEDSDVVFNTKDYLSPFSIDQTRVYFPEHVFPYIQAQSGVFTVHHSEGNNPVKFLPFEESQNSDLLLSKIEILPEFFSTIRYQLFRVGISPASLFPGLSGIVDKIRYDNILSDDDGTSETK